MENVCAFYREFSMITLLHRNLIQLTCIYAYIMNTSKAYYRYLSSSSFMRMKNSMTQSILEISLKWQYSKLSLENRKLLKNEMPSNTKKVFWFKPMNIEVEVAFDKDKTNFSTCKKVPLEFSCIHVQSWRISVKKGGILMLMYLLLTSLHSDWSCVWFESAPNMSKPKISIHNTLWADWH